MPVLTDLEDRLLHPPFDAAEYRARLPAAQAAAENIHVLHVTAAFARSPEWSVFLSILGAPPHEIPTSDHPDYCSDETRRAEALLGYPPSVYFYAGRAHPEFGNLALAFDAGVQVGRIGSVTPFDSGGIVWQPDPHIQVRLADDSMQGRVDYCHQSLLSLEEWRDGLGRVLAAYFDQLQDYWTGRPVRFDPEGLFELNDDWRCWTFEIRLAEPQPILDCVAWCADEAVMHELFRLHAGEAVVPGQPRPVHQFLRQRLDSEPGGTPFYCRAMETWVREQLGI
ncbi:MAG: hypothetical protein J5I93_29635 [Pirellulaceae bacterium]|nr:hypothetical protein [Pirellulaceae bacterium]